MHIVFSQIPTLWIIVFMIIGLMFHLILDFRIEAHILLLSALFSLIACYFRSSFKVLSAFILGMFILAEILAVQPPFHHTLHISMRGVIKGCIEESRFINDSTQLCIVKGYVDTPELPRIEDCRIQTIIHEKQLVLHPGMIIQCQSIIRNPRIPTLPDDFNEDAFAQSKNIQWFANARSVSIIDKGLDSYQFFVHRIRRWIKDAIQQTFPKETEDLSISLLLGEVSGLSGEMRESFALLGTAHILSVSGFHAGIIAMLLHIILAWIPSISLRVLGLCIALLAFLCIIEWDPPAMRACIMVTLTSITWSNQRMMHSLHGLFLTLSLMVCIEPILLQSIGFQMSALGMLGLVVFTEHFKSKHDLIFRNTHRISRFVSHSLSVSLSASIMLLPLTALYFDLISLVSPIANVVLLPAFTIALCWIFASICCYAFSFFLSQTFALAAHQTLILMIDIHREVSSWEWIAYTNHHASLMAIGMIVSIIALYQSRTISYGVIVVLASVIFLMGMHDITIALTNKSKPKKITIIERNDLLIMIQGVNQDRALILDRDTVHRRFTDKSLMKYLIAQRSIRNIFFAGAISKQLATAVKKQQPGLNIVALNRSFLKKCFHAGRVSIQENNSGKRISSIISHQI